MKVEREGYREGDGGYINPRKRVYREGKREREREVS
tara:strand:- start:266 stop:373 length:108 start_codon:yes stop_codon:yes gene_type:complete